MASPKHLHTYLLDAGLNYIAGIAVKTLHVVKNYALSDSYSTATAPVSGGGRSLGSVSYTISGVATGAGSAPKVARYVTIVPSSSITVAADNTANGVSDDLGIILTTTTGGNRILASTDLTPDSSIEEGNILTISSFTITFNQPT